MVSLREKMNQAPALAIGFVILAICLCALLVYKFADFGPSAPVTGSAFFTVDDGKTTFTDSRSVYPPFQQDGKTAVRAMMYSCDGGKTTFVGYLMKVEDPASKSSDRLAISVKRPGEAKWVPDQSAGGMAIMRGIKCPTGLSGRPEVVNP